MNKKIIAIFAVLVVILCCASIVSAENGTDDVQNDDSSAVKAPQTDNTADAGEPQSQPADLSGYITALSIGNTVKFSDGFSGFSLDNSKAQITSQDGFTASPTSSTPLANYLKLAVIECYKSGKEGEIESVIAIFVDGSYQSSSNPIVQKVLSSSDTIGDYDTVKIDNTTEATFEFEVLKPADASKADYFAYKVSFNTVPDEKLSAPDNGNDTNVTKASDDTNMTKANNDNDTNVTKANNDTNVTKANNDTNTTKASDNTNKNDTNNTKKVANKTAKKDKAVSETNRTVVNKTTTNVVNENNTTVVNHNNVKTYSEPSKKPAEPLKNVGNQIAILLAVVVLGGAIAVVLHKKD